MTNVVSLQNKLTEKQLDEVERLTRMAERIAEDEPDEDKREQKLTKVLDIYESIDSKREELRQEGAQQ